MDTNTSDNTRPDIPPEYAPKEGMSLREQFAQYSYNEMEVEAGTAAIMEAASEGKDIVFGETHSATAETMKQMTLIAENAPKGHIKAIAVELNVGMQELFDPVAIRDMSMEDFAMRASQIEYEATMSYAEEMYEAGTISEEQYNYMDEFYSSKLKQLEALSDYPEAVQHYLRDSMYKPYYEMAKTALDNGIPVYAADADGHRLVPVFLNHPETPPDLRTDIEQAHEIMNQGTDDRSDVEYLRDMGVDIDGPGALLAHRGYAHINGFSYGEAGKTEQSNGMDDVLERSGREVLSVYVGPDSGDANVAHKRLDVHDPAEIALIVDDTGKVNMFANPDALSNEGGEDPAITAPSSLPEMKM